MAGRHRPLAGDYRLTRYLLDSHVLVWALLDAPKLNAQTRELMLAPVVRYASIASLWELMIKRQLGKLALPDDFSSRVTGAAITLLPISVPHIEALAKLPPHHRDPFDRMLIAQAKVEGLTLITGDTMVARYDVSSINAC